MAHYTVSCSGCFEAGENMGRAGDYRYDEKAGCYLGAGCSECGYTGKRRSECGRTPAGKRVVEARERAAALKERG